MKPLQAAVLIVLLGFSFAVNTRTLHAADVRYAWNGPRVHALFDRGGDSTFEVRETNQSWRLHFSGSNPDARPRVELDGQGEVSQLHYSGLYPGIDAIFHRNGDSVEGTFEIGRNAEPELIRFDFGTAPVHLSASGSLEIGGPRVALSLKPPQVQDGAAGVSWHYVVDTAGTISLRLSPLAIANPVQNFTTILGGQGYNAVYAMAVDSSGNLYLAGETDSASFTGPGRRPNRDAFIVKLDSSGSQVLYLTYLSGNGADVARAISIDSAGNAYLAGNTSSTDFITTPGAIKTRNAGFEDVFVVKLNTAGNMVYSTLLGSSGSDQGLGIAVDGSGNIYVTGQTTGAFPATAGAVQTSFHGVTDCFVSKLNPNSGALLYSTLLGGSNFDSCRGIAVDTAGNAYVTGVSYSSDFPVQSALQGTLRGTADAFVTKLNSTGSAILYSTYLGGDSFDEANAIAIDAAGAVYVAGDTTSWNFPVTPSVPQANTKGGYEGFIAKLSPTGSSLGYATLIGGSGSDSVTGVAVDGYGRAVISGFTNSFDFPILQGPQGLLGGYNDAFIAVVDAYGSTFLYSSYLGGSGEDRAYATALSSGNRVYAAGFTQSPDFPGAAGGAVVAGNTKIFVVGTSGSWQDPTITVLVSPGSATLMPSQTQQFSVSVNVPNAGALWSVSPSFGSIDANGLYTAPPTITVQQTVTVTATSVLNGTAKGTGTITLIPRPSSTAQFVRSDTATQGSWKSVYGTDGYNVVNNAVAYPSYVLPVTTGASNWTWLDSSADLKALQQAGASAQRIAATWYTFDKMTIDLPFTDGQTHPFAVYCIDWDMLGRGQKVEILDSNNNVLDTRTVTNFTSGVWLMWNVSGHVQLRLTRTAGMTAVISGLFFGSQLSPTVQFVKLDTTSQGNWKSTYGTEGYNVVNNAAAYPSYVLPTTTGASNWTWVDSSTDVRALQEAAAFTPRIAATWYTFDKLTIDLPFSDTQAHPFAVYCIDWDMLGRGQKVELLDVNNNVLDTRTVTNFTAGVWLVWNVRGHVQLRLTRTAGMTAVISGLFFGPSPLPATAQFLKLDTATQGSWKNVYGTDGYNVVNNATAYPPYVLPATNGASNWTWVANTTDVRALQQAGATPQRIAATWYTFDKLTIDLPFVDSQLHQMAIYCIDWDMLGRGQTVELLDINNNVLDTRTVTNFNAGVWLVWNVSGHIQLRLTRTAGMTAVIAGLFFVQPQL